MKSRARLLAILLVGIMALSGLATALPDIIKEVKVDGTELVPNDVTRLDLERGKDFEIKVELESEVDLENICLLYTSPSPRD